MAPLASGSAFEVESAIADPVPSFSVGKPRRRFHFRWWRFFVLTIAGAYILIPLYAGIKFSLEGNNGGFSFLAYKSIPTAPGFTAALSLSFKLAVATIIVSTLLMVPTSIYVHLRMPRFRRVLDLVTVMPIVIPPIVLIVGVLGDFPLWAKSSPYLLSFMYVILAMPFVYRSLDAGLSAIDLKTLTEASRSLGGNWIKTMWQVIIPNIRPALLSATVLTLALVFGEYTMASLDSWQTIPVWIAQFQTSSDGHLQVAASMMGLVGTWILLMLVVSLDRSQSRRRRRQTV